MSETKKRKQGVLLISFDFEQHWGVFDSLTLKQYQQNLLGEKIAVPKILALFEKHNIHATWATVGFLFAKNKSELRSFFPESFPTYEKQQYSSYLLMDKIGNNEQEDPIHYAPSLIQKILATPNQELATHTFSHYYCLEKGQNLKQFQADLAAAAGIAKNFGTTLKSIVFPRNQCNPEFFRALKQTSIFAFRGVEKNYFYQAANFKEQTKAIRRLGRLCDSYVNITGHHTYKKFYQEQGVWNLPASRFFRPYFPHFKFLETFKLKRIKASMTYAAKEKEVFHLWGHTHNFGLNQEQNIAQLTEILLHFADLQRQFGMISLNMQELASELSSYRYSAPLKNNHLKSIN